MDNLAWSFSTTKLGGVFLNKEVKLLAAFSALLMKLSLMVAKCYTTLPFPSYTWQEKLYASLSIDRLTAAVVINISGKGRQHQKLLSTKVKSHVACSNLALDTEAQIS